MTRLRELLARRPDLTHADGVLGVVCVSAGAYVVAGLGVALLALGAFLLISAWSRR